MDPVEIKRRQMELSGRERRLAQERSDLVAERDRLTIERKALQLERDLAERASESSDLFNSLAPEGSHSPAKGRAHSTALFSTQQDSPSPSSPLVGCLAVGSALALAAAFTMGGVSLRWQYRYAQYRQSHAEAVATVEALQEENATLRHENAALQPDELAHANALLARRNAVLEAENATLRRRNEELRAAGR